MGQIRENPFLFQPNLDLQGPVCVTENMLFLSIDMCESLFFFLAPHPRLLLVCCALE